MKTKTPPENIPACPGLMKLIEHLATTMDIVPDTADRTTVMVETDYTSQPLRSLRVEEGMVILSSRRFPAPKPAERKRPILSGRPRR